MHRPRMIRPCPCPGPAGALAHLIRSEGPIISGRPLGHICSAEGGVSLAKAVLLAYVLPDVATR